MMSRTSILGTTSLLVALSACAAAPEDEVADGAGAVAASGASSFEAGIERKRAGSGSVQEVQQRSVHFGNAHALALLSQAAYAKESTPASLAALGVSGVTSVTAFDNRCTGGNAIYVTTPSVAVLAFRGTEVDSQLDIDIDKDDAFHAYPFERDGQSGAVHNGFRRQFESLWRADPGCGVAQGIGAFLEARHASTESSAKPLYFTGHSLGGALATLALAQTFVERTTAIDLAGVYTFGAPKVGNRTFAEVLGDKAQATRTPVYRFVHKNDIVPTQPRPFGTVFEEEWQHAKPHGLAEHALQVWFDAERAEVGTRVLFLGISFADHALAAYVDGIADHARRRNELR